MWEVWLSNTERVVSRRFWSGFPGVGTRALTRIGGLPCVDWRNFFSPNGAAGGFGRPLSQREGAVQTAASIANARAFNQGSSQLLDFRQLLVCCVTITVGKMVAFL